MQSQSVMIDQEYRIYPDIVIGKGEYGKVVLCEKTTRSLKGLCAKVNSILCQLIQVQDEVSANREAEILQKFLITNKFNPHIVQIFKVAHNQEKKVLIVVMERCSSNLQIEMNKKGCFTDQEIWDFLRQMITGYRFLYDNNILHRDIKPENILVEYFNNQPIYKLADFGVGKIYKHNDYNLTKTGTPVYAAPEVNPLCQNEELKQDLKQLKQLSEQPQAEKSQCKIDIYSMGMILLQLLQGYLPFETNIQGIIDFIQILKSQGLKIEVQNRDPALVDLIKDMIKYLPSQRCSFAKIQEQLLKRQTQNRYPNNQQGFQQVNIQNRKNDIQISQNNISQNFSPIKLIKVQKFQPSQGVVIQPQKVQLQQAQQIQQFQQEDRYLQEFISILQLSLDMYRSNNLNQEVVSIMSQFPLNQIPKRDNPSFRAYLLQVKQFFKYDSLQQYGEQYIKLIFGLRFYTQEIDQSIDPLRLDIFQMRQYLNK